MDKQNCEAHRCGERNSNGITQPSGAATPRNSDAHEHIVVPQALRILRKHTRPRPKSGKVRRSDTRPGEVCERAERSEGSDTPPVRNAPCFAVYTDFRTYLKFDLETTDQNGTKQLLPQTLNTKSGGETQTPFYIAVLASFAQLYRVNDTSSFGNTVRLAVFDEAFNKMDSDRIIESVRLLRRMGLQAIICTPPDKVSDIMPIANRTLLVNKDKYIMHILPFGKEIAQ